MTIFYSDRSWCVVGQEVFLLCKINQMQQERLGYLEWTPNSQHLELKAFTTRAQAELDRRSMGNTLVRKLDKI